MYYFNDNDIILFSLNYETGIHTVTEYVFIAMFLVKLIFLNDFINIRLCFLFLLYVVFKAISIKMKVCDLPSSEGDYLFQGKQIFPIEHKY